VSKKLKIFKIVNNFNTQEQVVIHILKKELGEDCNGMETMD